MILKIYELAGAEEPLRDREKRRLRLDLSGRSERIESSARQLTRSSIHLSPRPSRSPRISLLTGITKRLPFYIYDPRTLCPLLSSLPASFGALNTLIHPPSILLLARPCLPLLPPQPLPPFPPSPPPTPSPPTSPFPSCSLSFSPILFSSSHSPLLLFLLLQPLLSTLRPSF